MEKNSLTKDDLIIITRPLLERFLKEDKFENLISLYSFYYYTAKRQKTNKIRCTTNFTSKGLGWREPRVRLYKKKLKEMGLVKDVQTRDEKGISGWYIQVNYIIKDNTIKNIFEPSVVTKPTLLESVQGREMYGVDNCPPNALSTNTLNALSTNTLNALNKGDTGDVPSPEELPIEISDLSTNTKKILKEIFSLSIFKQSMKRPGERGFKTLLSCQTFLEKLETPTFLKKYMLAPKWMEKHGITADKLKIFRSGIMPDAVLTAVKRYKKLFDEKYLPKNKAMLTDNIAKFFYNYGTKTSYFLSCFFNEPKEDLSDVPLKLDGMRLNEDSKEFLQDIGKDWNTMIFSRKIRDLYDYWMNIRDDVKAYHDSHEVNLGNFNSQFYGFNKLLDRLREFYETWGVSWNIGNFGHDNKTWNSFVGWSWEEYGVKLDKTGGSRDLDYDEEGAEEEMEEQIVLEEEWFKDNIEMDIDRLNEENAYEEE